jgi:hypothetical protein
MLAKKGIFDAIKKARKKTILEDGLLVFERRMASIGVLFSHT